MRLYLDTEYNGFGGELISIALVPETGLSFYAVLDLPENIDPWVQKNVIPILQLEPRSREWVRLEFAKYLTKYNNPEVIADWHEDFVHFFDLFRGHDYPGSLDYRVTAKLLFGPNEAKSSLPHNAFYDALALRDYHEANRETA